MKKEREIIGDEPCPACRSKGRDKSGNHLICFSDGFKYCNRCDYKEEPDMAENPPKTAKVKRKVKRDTDISPILDLPMEKLESRGIARDIAITFGVRTEYSEETGEEVAHYYPVHVEGKLFAFHKRTLPKAFTRVGPETKGIAVDLFGKDICRKSGKKLLIVEGQDDCLAAYQMLYRKYPKFPPNVVALWGDSTKSLSHNLDWVMRYDEILIATDMDDAGHAVADKIAKLVGARAKRMEFSEKDPNDMLKAGKSEEFIDAFFSAGQYLPESILTVDDVYEEAIQMPSWGRLWPWPSLDNLTYGRRDGEGIFVGAAVKAGKTKWLTSMVRHVIEVDGLPAFMVKFEQPPAQTVKEIAGEIAHKIFTKPDGDFTQEELQEAVSKTKGKLFIFDASFTDVGQSNLWDRLKPAIRHAVLELGVKDVFIDPITQLTDGMTPTETETELRRFSNEIAGLAKELGFFYYCFCHLKSPESGTPHEEGGDVKVNQFRGSRAMAEKCKLMLGIKRNQQAANEVERNTSTFKLLLNSSFGKTGAFNVYYNPETGEYKEVERVVKPNKGDEY